MSEHLRPPQLERYRRGRLSPAELQTVDDHIGRCESCRELLNENLGNLEQLKSSLIAQWTDVLAEVSAETEHLSYEQVAAYVDRELGHEPFQEVQKHLSHCAECQERVQNLSSFQEEMEAAALINRPNVRRTLQQRFAVLWPSPRRLTPLQLVPTAAGAILVVAAVWLAWSSTRPPQEIAQVASPSAVVESSPAPLQSPPASPPLMNASPEITRPSPESSPPVVLVLNDGGGRVTLDEQGHLVGTKQVPSSYQQVMKEALATGEVKPAPALAGLFGLAGGLRGGSAEGVPFAFVGPVGEAVQTDRPTFRWLPLSEATSYTVTISDREKEVAASPLLSATEWTVPQSLPRGVIYTWQVTALKNGEKITSPTPPAPDARFKVLEQEKVEELKRLRENFAGNRLLLGSLYAQAGLLDDAEREFRALLAANPRSRVAQRLLRNLRAQRRPK